MIIKNIYDYIKFNISDACFLYNAPTNQKGTYIVMSQVDDVIHVETFAPNIGNDKTFPNFSEFTRVETALTELIPFTLKKGELKRNSSGLWSQIIEFKAFMYGNGIMRIKRLLNDGYGGVTAEYSNTITSANSLLVSATSLTTAYNTLNSYITPLLNSLTTNSTIVGTTFRANFSNYYTANVELLKSISVKLQSNIDGIEIGGRNLLLNSGNFKNTANWALHGSSSNLRVENGLLLFNSLLDAKTTPRLRCDAKNMIVFSEQEESYVLTATYKISDGSKTALGWKVSTSTTTANETGGQDWGGTSEVSSITNTDGTITTQWLVKAPKKADNYVASWFTLSTPKGTTFSLKQIKLEKGTKATDWTPAPEDVQSAIDTAQNSANTANNLLTQIASDSYLTALEKQQVANEWNRIKSEYTNNLALANSLLVSAIVCYVDSWNIANNRVDIAINKQYVVGSSILFNGNEFVVHSYKPINNNFTLCLTYKKSLTE